jgi:hypothetical protein
MTATTPRTRIRQWWKEQLATGNVLDLDAAAEEATQLLIADPAFVAALAETVVRPMVRDIGQKVTTASIRGRREQPVQLGSQVMSRAQAAALVDSELSVNRPHWSKLVQRDNEPQWFMALDKPTLMTEAKRRKEQGVDRLREATFLLAVANNLTDTQIVADVWNERELDALFTGIEVDVTASHRNVTFAFQFDKHRALGEHIA